MKLLQNFQHNFPKMRGGGQRPFGTFLKIHPFWWSFVIQNEEQANQQYRFERATKLIHYTIFTTHYAIQYNL